MIGSLLYVSALGGKYKDPIKELVLGVNKELYKKFLYTVEQLLEEFPPSDYSKGLLGQYPWLEQHSKKLCSFADRNSFTF